MKWSMLAMCVCLGVAGCNGTYKRSLADVRADGNANFTFGNYDAARADYEEYVERKPGSTAVRSRLGETLLKLDRPAAAEPHLRAAYDVDPLNTKNAALLAEAMIRGDRAGEGLDFMRRFLDQMPTSEGFFAMSDLAMLAGLPDDARNALLVAAKLDGEVSAEPHRRLAKFYEQQNFREQAVRRWRMVLWFDPADAEAGQALRDLGEVPGPGFVLEPTPNE